MSQWAPAKKIPSAGHIFMPISLQMHAENACRVVLKLICRVFATNVFDVEQFDIIQWHNKGDYSVNILQSRELLEPSLLQLVLSAQRRI